MSTVLAQFAQPLSYDRLQQMVAVITFRDGEED